MIKLKKLELKNFKGIKDFSCEFGEELTTISGANGTGKSTVFDAFTWLLFGKNSNDKKDFNIQTLDQDNNVIHHLDCEVVGTLVIDGKEKVLKRLLQEKWQKKRGEVYPELRGTVTTFEIDGIPVKQKEYQEVINEIVDENIFKMITNPAYFSSLNWTKQREILLEIIGDISEEDVINYNKELEPLKDLLSDGIDNFNKRTKSSIAKLKDQVKTIPARIDECNNNIKDVDFEFLESKKNEIQSEINSIDEQISDLSKYNEKKIKLQDEVFKAREEMSKQISIAIQNFNAPLITISDNISEVKNYINEKSFKVKQLELNVTNKEKYISELNSKLEELNITRRERLKQYHFEDDKVFEFDDKLKSCPTCGREYEPDKLEEIKTKAEEKFNNRKKEAIDAILHDGKKIAADIEKTKKLIEKTENEITDYKTEIKEINLSITDLSSKLDALLKEKESINLSSSDPYFEGKDELKNKIKELQSQLDNFKENDTSELKQKKKELQLQLESINKDLGRKDTNEELKKRMEELNSEEKELQIKIAELEGHQFLGEQFIRTKVELLEGSINKKFKGAVTFKLFNNQVNGGLSETCEALINGVPFSDANTAAKINAGLSIINTLCEHYNISAPVFVDNSESVNELNKTGSQLIKLVVSLDKKLNVEVNR